MLNAADIMSRNVQSVTPDTTIDDLAKRFIATGVSTMPVITRDGKLAGIVTETDLVEQDKPLHIPTVIALFDWVVYLESEKDFRNEVSRVTAKTVGEICTKEVITCTPETTTAEIAALMTEKKVHLIPVVSNGEVVGVVGRHDIIRSMNQ